MTAVRGVVTRWLLSLIDRIAPDEARYFDDEDRMTPDRWLGLFILHAEAVHGCEHTGEVREAISMVGVRGRAAE